MKAKVLTLLFALSVGVHSAAGVESTSPSAAAKASPALQIHGTRVSLQSPSGFTPAAAYCGVENRDLGASIMVTELQGPYDQISAGFNEAALKSKGITLLSKASTTAGSFPGILLQISQPAFGTKFLKWIMAFGDEEQTVLVTGTWPESAPWLGDSIKSAVVSARLDVNAPPPDPMADLTFTIRDTAKLKMARRLQNMLFYGPADKTKGVLFIVGQSLVEAPIPDKSGFARQRILSAEGFSDVKVESEADIVIGNLPGREIMAVAKDAKTEKPIFLYQTVLFPPNTYYILQGIADNELRASYEQAFKELARQFKPKAIAQPTSEKAHAVTPAVPEKDVNAGTLLSK